ncbi:MAG TPA: caspase family protein [Pseudonocardia sp.]|uniref:caspase, EACC1-associated type n=1 Tax=Pseudonocardia sp. TaxID=60912 RepID=UPI002F3E2EDA
MARRLALLIATYQHEDSDLRGLTSPAADVDSLAEVLRDPAIAGFEVSVLTNQPHHRVGEAIGRFYRDCRRDDLTLLYFTGHGLKDEDGRLYLAMSNTHRDDLLFTALPAEQLDQAMNSGRSRQKVLVLDCCYSGAFPAGRIAKADTEVHALDTLRGQGRTVLTASDAMQYSFEGDQLHGQATSSVFTRCLVEGLRDGSADLDRDGNVTLDELYAYVYERVVEEMPQQRPKKQDNVEGRTVIARNINWTLPDHLRNAMDSPIAVERLAALDGLAHLYKIGNQMVRGRARDEMHRLAEDDSRMVSSAAAARLAALEPPEATAEQRAQQEAGQLAQRDAAQRSRREAEQRAQQEAEQRAQREAEQRAQQEAEQRAQREAEQRAQREAEQRAQREAEQRAQREAGHRERDEQARQARQQEARQAAGQQERYRQESERQRREHQARQEAEQQERVAEQARRERLDHVRKVGPWVGAAAVVVTLVLLLGYLVSGSYGKDGGATSSSVPKPPPGLPTVVASVPVGHQPGRVAVTPDGRHAYITDYGANTVSVIDTADNALAATIRVGQKPTVVAVAPDGRRAYVTNSGADTVSVIDVAGNAVTDTVPVKQPTGIAVTPDSGHVYVSNNGSDSVSVIDAATFSVATIPAGRRPAAVAISADGRYAYVTNLGSGSGPGSVSMIDIATSKIVATIPVGAVPGSVAAAPDGRYAYVTNFESDTVTVVDTASRAVAATISVSPKPACVAIGPNGDRGYVTNQDSGTVSVIDTASNAVVGTVPVEQPNGVAISPDGSHIYTANTGTDTVSVLGVASG